MSLIPTPDVSKFTPEQFIMWTAAILLAFSLWTIPSSINSRMDAFSAVQMQMVSEHQSLLKAAQIQCYNHAENVLDAKIRANQQRRCLTLQLNAQPE